MKLIITEEQYNKIFEMAYPASFNMEEFKTLRNFAQRFQYCKQRLEYISSGSGRYVFGIDEYMVLKLAKNQKGVAQNQQEVDVAAYSSVVGRIYDYDDNFLWIEMERVNKITPNQFKQLTGIDFKTFQENIKYHDLMVVHPSRYLRMVKPENHNELWENEFFMDIADLIGSYDMPSGDLTRINSYGVTRNGQVKLVDAGLNQDVHDTYYKR